MEEGKKWRLKVQVITMATLVAVNKDTLPHIQALLGLKVLINIL